MAGFVLVWGNPRDPRSRVAYRVNLSPDCVSFSPDGRYTLLDAGPTTVEGPVISRATGSDPLTVVLVDQEAIPWAGSGVPTDWGWRPTEDFPAPSRLPFQTDLLLLSIDPEGKLEGWSRTLWLDAGVRPMQRVPLPLSHMGPRTVPGHVLECGTAARGTGYAVVYCPDRPALLERVPTDYGWWKEPWVQIRAKDWSQLASLSLAIEAQVATVLRNPLVASVTVHDLLGIPDGSLPLLPVDVRDSLRAALEALPDAAVRDS